MNLEVKSKGIMWALYFKNILVMSKFYTFNQNNSGGRFEIDETGISEFVIIEANSASEANDIAESMGIYFDGCYSGLDCSCCGDRWYPVDESDATEEPEIYGESPRHHGTYTGKHVFVHYLNGVIEKIQSNNNGK